MAQLISEAKDTEEEAQFAVGTGAISADEPASVLIIGGVMVMIAITLIVIGARGRRTTSDAPSSEERPLDATFAGAPLPSPTLGGTAPSAEG